MPANDLIHLVDKKPDPPAQPLWVSLTIATFGALALGLAAAAVWQ